LAVIFDFQGMIVDFLFIYLLAEVPGVALKIKNK